MKGLAEGAGTTVDHGMLLYGMEPMTTFDPDVPCKVHERLNNRTLDWRTRWAQVDGTVRWTRARRLVYLNAGTKHWSTSPSYPAAFMARSSKPRSSATVTPALVARSRAAWSGIGRVRSALSIASSPAG